MEQRPAFDLRRALVMWNTGHAVFSIFGTFALTPSLFEAVYYEGVVYSVCYSECWRVPEIWSWGFFFVLFKVVELGDTAFIVLRKTPLPFLHWYHHITVLLYCWYAMGTAARRTGHWFASMNFFIHSIMYSYYALKASGRKVPTKVAQLITLLQLSQMFVGAYINTVAYLTGLSQRECRIPDTQFLVGMGMYVSYAILFMNFFYHRYIKRAKQE